MLIKNRFQFLVAVLLLAIFVGGILIFFIALDNNNQVIDGGTELFTAPPGLIMTNQFVETSIAATMTAKVWTATPTQHK